MWGKERAKSQEPRAKSQEPRAKNQLILQVEHRWLQPLYQFVKEEFSHTWLPSHDHTHHLRVWSYAKDLISTLHDAGWVFSEAKLEQLMVAVFFHDTGLTRTLDASHGKESREICRRFLEGKASFPAESLNEILEAVEKHDDKSYADRSAGRRRPPDDILTLLAVCDDLDAFGSIGVFRYLEIYLQRGIPLHSLPARVRENLEKRFGFLVRNYSEFESFVHAHQKRYQYAVDFYMELDRQYNAASDIPAERGPAKVVTQLVEKVLHEKIPLNETASHMMDQAPDEYSRRFFRQLESELQ